MSVNIFGLENKYTFSCFFDFWLRGAVFKLTKRLSSLFSNVLYG